MTVALSTYTGTTDVTGNTSGFGLWQPIIGRYNVSIHGTTWTGTIKVERRFSTYGATGLVVDSFTANTEQIGHESEDNVFYRIGMTTASSGIVNCRLSQ